ncbi:Organic hydroperoxide resistance transcriptional regulator [Clostridiaceae bacterium JG1575]|nr:Organic hydroperoxide resistance transcriptional regulator [Clostridiaceae bacterium JG1575]
MNSTQSITLEQQICFRMYLAVRKIVFAYNTRLAKEDLTYTQYLVMLVLWEQQKMDMKELGKRLMLDSRTLTPLLNRLVEKGLLTKERGEKDKRRLIVSLTEAGALLRAKITPIPKEIYDQVSLDPDEASALTRILDKIIIAMK